MGRIERPPEWILEYKERIEKGAITVEDILEAENARRENPIKISSVTRAINTMNYPITGLRRKSGGKPAIETGETKEVEKGPEWLQKYREAIETKTITVEAVLEAENKIREVPIKLITVTRAINTMGYRITGLRRGKEAEAEEEEKEIEPVKGLMETGGTEREHSWLQKYREGIGTGKITVEHILESENKTKEVPIKIVTLTRALKAMGLPITVLQSAKEAERAEPGKIGQGPGWMQKYREGLEKGTIAIEEILEAESRIRAEPVKMATVARALKAMSLPISGLQRRGEEEAEVEKEKAIKKREGEERAEKGPGWMQKYRKGLEEGTITIEDIMEAENKIRASPVKMSSVSRAINAMGYPITDLRRGKTEELKKEEKTKKEAVVYSCSIGKISEATEKRFNDIKNSWEEDLDKSLHNDYFVNILLALAKLVELGKTLTPAK